MKIVITGTSRGLGLSLAQYLSENHFVIGCARSEHSDQKFLHIPGVDFKDSSTLSILDPYLKEADGLINNVGMAFDGLLATQSQESIEEIIQVNLTSTLILTKNYIRERLKNKKIGNIINISSIIGIRGYAGLASYAATKAGLDGMTRALAREMGPKGFRINSVLPGYMETEMSKSLSKDQKKKIINRTPLGRLGKVEDIAPLVEFLLSEQSNFITGQSLVVDGGITI